MIHANIQEATRLPRFHTQREILRKKIMKQLIIRKVVVAPNDTLSDSTTVDEIAPSQNTVSSVLENITSPLSKLTSSKKVVHFSEPIVNVIYFSDDKEMQGTDNNCSKSDKQSRTSSSVARFIYQSLRSKNETQTCCEICLMDYEVGDEVCFSPNKDCTHAFHTECIADWLLKNNTCPVCRQDYLEVKSEDKGKISFPLRLSD